MKKIFTPKEQSIITASADPFTSVWRLWSMKESAYKVFIQAGGKRFFNPTKIECSVKDSKHGQVIIDTLNLKTSTIINASYIFSTAAINNSDIETCIFQLTEKNSDEQSSFMHQHLLNDFAKKNNLNNAELEIQKNLSGVPLFRYKNKTLNTSISLSHHGGYGAYSILNS
jgi:phosphopantetheinyl transferase (holo-ACP synthase)